MPPIRCFGLGSILVAVLLLLPFTGAMAGPADELKALVEQGRSKDAYELGTRHPESLGEPDFDFFFGVAAVNAGHAGEGVLALERYLLRFPANTAARVELARAYFVLGEDVRAREEFQNVLRDQPPPNLQTTVERYLERLTDLERIARGYEGVEKVYAISAGREIRIFVNPGKVSDLATHKLARDIAERVQKELKYPGEIKVNVIRENRVVEFAR